MRYWVFDLIIVKRSVYVNKMIVGKYLKSVKKNSMRNVIIFVYKELEMNLRN